MLVDLQISAGHQRMFQENWRVLQNYPLPCWIEMYLYHSSDD